MPDQPGPDSRQHVQSDPGPLDLRRKFKVHEAAIQVCLLACGLLSILTTLGIILVLGNESIAFFTRDQWVNSNRAILSDMDDRTTIFTVDPGKALEAISEIGVIRVGQEVMEVVEFQNNQIDIAVLGTGSGFERFCASDALLAEHGFERPMIVNASRPIKQNETDLCAANGITPIGFRVATDALAITVSSENSFVSELTLGELQHVFGEAELWSEVRDDWPDEPIQLVSPGTDSGTFDFFIERIFDDDPSAMLANNPIMSENDSQLVGSIHRNPFSIGFFGYAWYQANKDDLRIVALDGVEPSADTEEDGSYALSRPLFIYSDAEIMRAHPQVKGFISYTLAKVNQVVV